MSECMTLSSIDIDYSVLETLASSREGIEFLEVLWLSESEFQEAFQALCSVLTRGKDLCSPTKRHKRKANEKYFASLSGLNLESRQVRDRLVSGTHSTKVLRLAKGLTDQSDRWASISVDEVLSIVLLIDAHSKGSVTWNEFYNFCQRVDTALMTQNGKNSPQRSISELYITMVSERQSLKTNRFVASKMAVSQSLDSEEKLNAFTTQLIKLAIYARLNGMNPLTLLVNLKVHERVCIHQKKKEEGTRSADDAGKISSTSSSNDSYIPTDALVSLFMHLGANIVGTDEGGLQRAKEDFHLKLAQSSAFKGNAENINNISEIAILDNSPMQSTPDLSKRSSNDGQDLDSSIAMLRENAHTISARLASQATDVDAAVNIWSALQTLETELTKANSANSSPRTPGNKSTSPATPLVDRTNSPSSGRPSPIQLFATPGSNMKRTLSGGVVADNDSIASTASKQASVMLNSSLSSITDRMRESPISALTTSRANLSIFKSPSCRSGVAKVPNTYSEETMSWEGSKANLTNRFNERFQTTHQCADAMKIFKVLGVGEAGAC